MWALASLIFITLQYGVFSWAYFTGNRPVFELFFTELSPVLVFFTLLEKMGISISLRLTNYLFLAAAWNALKYISYICAFNGEGKNRFLILALILEAVYVGTVTVMLVYYQEL